LSGVLILTANNRLIAAALGSGLHPSHGLISDVDDRAVIVVCFSTNNIDLLEET
jgi:hypothetical protein